MSFNVMRCQAIYDTAMACVRLREDYEEEDVEDLIAQLQPALQVCDG